MEKLLEQAQGLNASLQSALTEAREKVAEANRLSAEARITKNKLDALKIELDDREAELNQGEAPVKAAHTARRIQQENAALSAQLEEEKHALEKDKRSFKTECATERAAIKKDKEEIEQTRINFREQADALAEEKLAFKKKLKDLGIK
jgi:hypothetical protein